MSIEAVENWFRLGIEQARRREFVGVCGNTGANVRACYHGVGWALSGNMESLIERMDDGADKIRLCREMLDVIGGDPKNRQHVADALGFLRRWLPAHMRHVIRQRRGQFAAGFMSNGKAAATLLGIVGPRGDQA